MSGALTADEFSGLLQTCGPLPQRIAIAVSGGPDSMALAFCLKRATVNSKIFLIAFIVDHALRETSATEAEQTQQRLTTQGIQAEILRWQHGPVTSRLHVAARDARYNLLHDACKKHSINTLFLGHQREDQAETILMRLAKGSGIDGLAGMSALTAKENLHLLRPLLSIAKERLIATCEANNITFIADPSNGSDKFARGRLRRVLPLLADEGITIDRLLDLGTRAADASDALTHATDLLLRVAGRMDTAGTVRLDLEHLRSAPHAVALRAIAASLQIIHPAEYDANYTALDRITTSLRTDQEMAANTLQGCLISKAPNHAVFQREFSVITEILPAQPGETQLWDRRWRVTTTEPGEWRPLGQPPHETLDRLAPGLRQAIQQGRSRAGLPSLWQQGELRLIPNFIDPAACTAVQAKLAQFWPPTTAKRKLW